ncbi:hypothetical protein ANOM_002703 [Aspergillus nomiae NRRL 13137]|uniref:Uncharacterized protein n=1 Tax=Aspergillus nomiae NRRL (strain ATCC 15546 / NRRL 13137 / CBS 260.88 / M93) TaxID=1509407 RepID=A0A0L1JAU1_ASPN3|nr:uncharacterized protein ANOM_002703 [Aspergillus nomiae NRRL 13137]KNG88528.1 hypothetical protein ANOM_002703 [Aspergillus nomiae NRRL 13137]
MLDAHRGSTGIARSTSPPAQPTPATDQGPAGMLSLDGVEEAKVLVPITQTVAIITSITCITGIGNLLVGLLTVCIPVIVADLHIPSALQLRPTAAFALACGCMLLPCGAAADMLGCRRACLLGGLLQTASALGAGLSAAGTQLIALSPHRRSNAFAAMGGGQAVGFGLGLALGVRVAGPGTVGNSKQRGWWSAGEGILARLHRDIDWVGALLISACLALLSYELAVATGSDADQSMRQPLNLVLHCSALALILVFALWMRRQVRPSRPALIPNSLWTNVPFMAVCITVFLVWGTLNASEQLTALYLQDARGTSTLTASLYFMPAPVRGLLMNAAIGISLPYFEALDRGARRISCEWYRPAPARNLTRRADLIYTIANLVMTDSFPVKMQALAGGVFNMLAQVGKGVGIATSALIARQITSQTHHAESANVFLKKYKAGWSYNCALGFASVAVSFGGLRSVKRLEIKRD